MAQRKRGKSISEARYLMVMAPEWEDEGIRSQNIATLNFASRKRFEAVDRLKKVARREMSTNPKWAQMLFEEASRQRSAARQTKAFAERNRGLAALAR